MTLLLAFNLLWPIVAALESVITAINGLTHNLGWSLVVLAFIIRIAFWPLNAMQFRSMAKMQILQPQVKAIQEKYKNDPPRMTTEIKAVYAEHGTSPFAGCLPLLVQLPILLSIYQAINADHEAFTHTGWGWIGTPISFQYSHILATNLAVPDIVLLVLYVLSMFLSVRLSSPAPTPDADPQQVMTQQIMAIISPTMIAVVGRNWPSGLILFWLVSNVVQTLQQLLLRRQASAAATAGGELQLNAAGGTLPRSAAPTRDAAHSSRRPRKGPRRSSR